MFEKYWLYELNFVKVLGKKENYDYICIKKPEYENVYVPSLGKAFAPYEIEYIRKVEASDMLDVMGLEEKVRFDIDEGGAAYAYYWGKLSNFDVRRMERAHNKAKKAPKVDNRFTRR